MTKWLVTGAWLLLAASAMAQTANPSKPVAPIAVGDILLTLPSSHIPDAGTWEVRFSHRFNQNVDKNVVHSLFGLDSGANVGLGLSYVPVRDLQLSLVRNSALETYEGAVKYEVFQQARALPFTVALRGGIDYRNAQSLDDRSSLFAQAIVSRQFGSHFDLYAAPGYVTNAGRATNGTSSQALFRHAFNVPVGAVFELGKGLGIAAEVIPQNRDLPDSIQADLGWSLGIKHAIGGHYFEVFLTNSNGMTVDQYT